MDKKQFIKTIVDTLKPEQGSYYSYLDEGLGVRCLAFVIEACLIEWNEVDQWAFSQNGFVGKGETLIEATRSFNLTCPEGQEWKTIVDKKQEWLDCCRD